jgi:glycosyltransferase involved in cell wall biosynthesis
LIEIKEIDQPLVSVVIATFNRAFCIEKAINSVINQSYKNWELIIIDDGSTDSTREVIGCFLKDERIKYFKQENKGGSEARNKGIKIACGNYIALLDDDDEFLENKLSVQISEMLKYKADFSLSNGFKVYNGKRSIPNNHSDSFLINTKDIFTKRFHISCSYMMFKSSIKEECLFDTSLTAAIDFDLFVRMAGKYKVLFINEPLAYIHKSFKRDRISNNPQMKINTFELLIKKADTYNWSQTEKQKAVTAFTLQLGFWQIIGKKYKEGRKNINGILTYLPPAKKIKFRLIYLLSYFPPGFRLVKLAAEELLSRTAGRIRL